MGWWAKAKSVIPQVLLGLENFYIAGQWTQASGGVSGVMISGRVCINKITEPLEYLRNICFSIAYGIFNDKMKYRF